MLIQDSTGGGSASAEIMAGAMGAMDPGGVPHYFGPYANYANSPVPTGSITSITVENQGSTYLAPVVTITDVWGTGAGATANAVVVNGKITGINMVTGGSGYSAPIVRITDPSGTGAVATANMDGALTGGIRKFVDSLPGLGASNANNLGNYIGIAIPDTTTYPGCDYYEIALVRYFMQMSSDLPTTLLNGYVQLETPANAALSHHVPLSYINGTPIILANGTRAYGVDYPHYLGPVIVSSRDIPVRLKFTNLLPTGSGGDLFLPVDTTTMGAGMGNLDMMGMPGMKENYTQNRATLHLHGGATPWISDGTPHQWTTPANEMTQYPKGVSVAYVPDMWFVNGDVIADTVGQTTAPPGASNDPGDGSLTFYYTNQQSARFMFYHDHAYGITRLNVYSGEAAGYLLTDSVENALIDAGIIPSLDGAYAYGIPLIIQDKTFVDANTIAYQDPTWAWGSNGINPTTGDLWFPHVYMPNQNPYSPTGANDIGRWDYGPWFFPPTDITYGPVPNPYYDPINAPNEPPMIPGVPNVSSTMEAFMDTPVINGQAYPYLNVDPQAYRFRILNAANDRFFNLQLYVADPNVVTWDGRTNTEVNMVPAVATPGFPELWPTDGRPSGVPNPAYMGPDFIQIGTEGGFLPSPVVIKNQPVTFNYNPKTFTYGNVQDHALLLGSAERADVIIDFSQYAGKTLILYNDAPAGFPANDPRNDYYTNDGDQTAMGGATNTQPGYGPNTRTIMQIRVANITGAPTYNMDALNDAFSNTSTHKSVFEMSQDPILVPQAAYDAAYNGAFSDNAFVRIQDKTMTFTTLTGESITIDLQPKAIHDEMGGSYDVVYGRMSGSLGLEVPSGTAVTQQFIPLGYASPPVELLSDSMIAMSPVLGDGTQIWKITHNGVDTHAMHVHLFNAQLINRVGWDGAIYAPDANEIGWKETIRVDPLSDTIIAMRPVSPLLPWEVPSSYRLIDPTLPEGDLLLPPPGGFFDPAAVSQTVTNHYVNYGWEYVWHCHLLEHEEMDMMHSMGIAVAPYAPINLDGIINPSNSTWINMTWIDNSIAESGYIIQRNTTTTPYVTVGVVASPHNTTGETKGNLMYFNDTIVNDGVTTYYYRVLANSLIGDTYAYPVGIGYPTLSLNSTESNLLKIDTASGTAVALPAITPPGPGITPPPGPGASGYTVAFNDIRALMIGNPKTVVTYVARAPIRIDSDSEFTSANGVTSGLGTQLSPYVIENFTIDAKGFGYGIYIGNTTKYFVVRNCQLNNATGGLSNWEYRPDSGLVLRNATNGTLANNVLTANSWAGIYISGSKNITVFNETISNNYMGMYLRNTNNSVISFNEISNGYSGLWLYASHSNTMANNTLVHNYPGTMLADSTWNTFVNNTFFANTAYGLWLHTSGDNRIYSNDFIENNGANDTYRSTNVQAYDDTGTNTWNGVSSGNYWYDLTTPDVAPPSGIVDVPYLIDGGSGAKDDLPLSRQVVVNVLTSIHVAPSTTSVIAGDSLSFTALAINQYGNIIAGTTFNWTTDVGTVTSTGTFKAQKRSGSTGYVRAANGTISGDAVVTIVPGALDHINVTPPTLGIVRGMTQQFVADGQDIYNNSVPGLTYTWSTDVGTINSAGLFVAQQTPGTGYVHADSNFKTGVVNVTVWTGTVSYIIVTPNTVSVVANQNQSFTAMGYDSFNNAMTGLTFTWSTNVGTMNGSNLTAQTSSGMIGFVKATSGVVNGTATVTIVPDALDHIAVSPSTLPNAVAGTAQQFAATGYDVYNNTIPGLTFEWNTTVGTISNTGLFTAQTTSGAVGYVNASTGGITGTATVTIGFSQLTYIVITPGTANVVAGSVQNFSAVGYDVFNNMITGLTFTWSTNVGTMTGSDLIAQTTAGAVGYVRATNGVVSGNCAVTIVPDVLDHIGVSPSNLSNMVAGTTQQFAATGYDVYNNTISGLTFEWNTTVGTISNTGLFTAQTMSGVTGIVNASTGGITGTATVTIGFSQLTYIVITPGTVDVVAGSVQNFSVVGYDVFNNMITGLTFMWSTNVGTMNGSVLNAQTSSGMIGYVKATSGVVNGTATVTIVPGALDHIGLSPSNLGNVVAGTAQQFTATGYDVYNNTVPGLTFEWNTTVGTITSTGLFTAPTMSGVTGIVNASTGGITGTATVTIGFSQLTYIVITPGTVDVVAGSVQNFSAVGYDQYNNTITGLTFTWSTNVGTMTGSDLIAQTTAGAVGYVSATNGVVSGNCAVTIVPDVLDHIVISPSSLPNAVAGTTQQFAAIGYDVYNNTISGLTFEWNTTVGTITSTGLFTAPTGAGISGQVKAISGEVIGAVSVQIVPDQLTHIVITPNSTDVRVKTHMGFMAVGYDRYENPISGLTFTWSTNVGKMNGTTLVAQKDSGKGFVSASVGTVTGYSVVNITPPPFNWIPVIVLAGVVLLVVAAVVLWFRRGG